MSDAVVLFSVQHPDQEALLEFRTRDDIVIWAERERQFWASLGISGIHGADTYNRSAQTELQRLADAAKKDEVPDGDLAQRLKNTAPQYFLSTGPRGCVLDLLRTLGYPQQALTAALSLLLGRHDELRAIAHNPHWLYPTMVATAHVAAFQTGGDPAHVLSLIREVTDYQKQWNFDLTSAKDASSRQDKAHAEALARLEDSLTSGEKKVSDATEKYEKALHEIRTKFEEQFALRTPMTYWNEKAKRHKHAARLYRNSFAGLMIGGVMGLSLVGALALFPFLTQHANAYWALILFSVAIALLAWPLRMTSKQYLVHQQLFEDAEERWSLHVPFSRSANR